VYGGKAQGTGFRAEPGDVATFWMFDVTDSASQLIRQGVKIDHGFETLAEIQIRILKKAEML
jgi:hypothetical protein